MSSSCANPCIHQTVAVVACAFAMKGRASVAVAARPIDVLISERRDIAAMAFLLSMLPGPHAPVRICMDGRTWQVCNQGLAAAVRLRKDRKFRPNGRFLISRVVLATSVMGQIRPLDTRPVSGRSAPLPAIQSADDGSAPSVATLRRALVSWV